MLIFQLLLEFGADINLKNDAGRSIMHYPMGAEFHAFLEGKFERFIEGFEQLFEDFATFLGS